MTPTEAEGWAKVAVLLLGSLLPAYGVWVVMQKRVTDLEAKDSKRERIEEAARAEVTRQQEAWWDTVEEIRTTVSNLEKTCSNATTELRTLYASLKERVDLHSTTTIQSLAGVTKNYNEMLISTMDVLRGALTDLKRLRGGE